MNVKSFIKPCPLCGKELGTCTLTVGAIKEIQGSCTCGLTFSIKQDIFGPEEPLQVWNTRIMEEAYKQELHEEVNYTEQLQKAIKEAGLDVPERKKLCQKNK